ncbi:uncharacterized protein TNCV_431171 [Trichonephila clavipes]|nr:uncharacterized protein TNCV_431171 [Trichonephila clavipes]
MEAHRLGTQNALADVLSRNPVESTVGKQANCAIIRDLVFSWHEQLIEEQRKVPELGNIFSYLETPDDIAWLIRQHVRTGLATFGRKLITPFQKLVMVSDGTEFAVWDVEKLFDEPSRNTKTKHKQWAKYYKKRRRDVRFKTYHQRKSDEKEIRTSSSDSSGSRYKSNSFEGMRPRSDESQYSRNNGSGHHLIRGQNQIGEARRVEIDKRSLNSGSEGQERKRGKRPEHEGYK